MSPKATTSPCEQHPALYVAEPGFYPRSGRRKKHRFSRGHRRDCARHHPSQVAVGGAAKVNTSRSQHFESRKRRIYEVLFAELLKLGAPSGPDVMKHWLKAEATSAEVGLSAFWRTPHFFSGNQTRKTLLFVVVPLNLPIYLILGRRSFLRYGHHGAAADSICRVYQPAIACCFSARCEYRA